MGRIAACLLGAQLCVALIFFASASNYQPRTETYLQTVYYKEQYCSYYRCGYTCHAYWNWWYWWWWWWRSYYCSYTSTCSSCYLRTQSRQESRTRCTSGWTGPNCNIPVCTPSCTGGKTCRPSGNVNTCQCITSGGASCKAEGCSPSPSCYPGTCQSGNTCACPSPFAGTNCETMLQVPEVSRCKVKLFTGNPEREVASADCAVEGHDPEVTWVAERTFSRVDVSWVADYRNPFEPVLPTETLHIKDYKYGVRNTNARVTVTQPQSSSQEKEIRPECRTERDRPDLHAECPNKALQWNEFGLSTIKDNTTIEVVVFARLGGYKILHRGDTRESVQGSNQTQRKVMFRVDASPPFHCRRNASCKEPTIFVENDAVKNRDVTFEFRNFVDSSSGISHYHVEIYELLKTTIGDGTALTRRHRSAHTETINSTNKLPYSFPAPGVYSVELTVFDLAKNSIKARKIMLYDNENHLKKTKQPLIISKSSTESQYRWITEQTRTDENGQIRLSLSWSGRYFNEKHMNEGWLSRVEEWKQTEGIDDNVKELGNRTTHEVPNKNGTVGYRIAFKVDTQGGIDLSANSFPDTLNYTGAKTSMPESVWSVENSETVSKDLVMRPLTARDTVVIWMQAFDIVGNGIDEKIFVRVDNSLPIIESNNPATLRERVPDAYNSKIEINAKDPESGIGEVRYYIYDPSLRVNVTPTLRTAKPELFRSVNSGLSHLHGETLATCDPSAGKCYCISGGECFLNVVAIEIDHCEIDKYYGADKSLQLHYVVVNQAGLSVKHPNPFTIKFVGGPPECRSVPLFTAGTIMAIVIGFLILVAVVVLAVFMVLRWKQDKHPIPDRVRTFASSMKQRITNTEKVCDSDGRVIYRSKTRRGRSGGEDEDDIYVDGSDPGGWRVNRDQVELAETIAEGRFAIVKKAYLKKGGETKTVAAKFLPAGASDSDKNLIKAKIAFHGNRVPPHDNIVRLMGVLDEGPVMLLEYCDLTLKEWLSKAGKVTPDVLENLLNFTLHIANGMEHLHSKSIIHRRLAVRNVLVKKDGMNGLVAKLIGFGTFDDSAGDDQAEEQTANVAVPLKWLAPETLETVNKGKAVYTQKSDVWSYGVTVWEIYSLGATPYPGKKSAEVEAILKKGYRMPRPDECPPELFDTVVTPSWNEAPKKRPDFKTICKAIRNFKSGGGDQQDAYYAVNPGKKTYDNPKERTTQYATKAVPNEYTGDELYDDTRK